MKICKIEKSINEFYTMSRYIDKYEAHCKACDKLRRTQYYGDNQIKENKRMSEYAENKNATDIEFKLKKNLRNRLNMALKNNYKTGSAIRDLGCPIEELKLHLESQFEDWMTWDNWGKYNKDIKTWQIDHIKPLNKFNLVNPRELLKACNYYNLQPLLAKDNLSKGGR